MLYKNSKGLCETACCFELNSSNSSSKETLSLSRGTDRVLCHLVDTCWFPNYLRVCSFLQDQISKAFCRLRSNHFKGHQKDYVEKRIKKDDSHGPVMTRRLESASDWTFKKRLNFRSRILIKSHLWVLIAEGICKPSKVSFSSELGPDLISPQFGWSFIGCFSPSI